MNEESHNGHSVSGLPRPSIAMFVLAWTTSGTGLSLTLQRIIFDDFRSLFIQNSTNKLWMIFTATYFVNRWWRASESVNMKRNKPMWLHNTHVWGLSPLRDPCIHTQGCVITPQSPQQAFPFFSLLGWMEFCTRCKMSEKASCRSWVSSKWVVEWRCRPFYSFKSSYKLILHLLRSVTECYSLKLTDNGKILSFIQGQATLSTRTHAWATSTIARRCPTWQFICIKGPETELHHWAEVNFPTLRRDLFASPFQMDTNLKKTKQKKKTKKKTKGAKKIQNDY